MHLELPNKSINKKILVWTDPNTIEYEAQTQLRNLSELPILAGRRMSRSKAKKKLTLEDAISQTEGVECKKDSSIIDELPSAYKDIDEIMEFQSDLVQPIAILKQVLCVKG